VWAETRFPVDKFRAAVDSMKAPPTPVTVASPTTVGQGILFLQIETTLGRTDRLESSANLTDWALVRKFTATNEAAG
jgi:hypothetical protein